MAFKTSDIDIMYVRNGLDHDSLDLGTLCLSNKINPWSANKPMNFSSTSYSQRVEQMADTSGFKVDSRKLVHQPPTAEKGFYLTDFEGYDPNARRPSNVIQNEFVLESRRLVFVCFLLTFLLPIVFVFVSCTRNSLRMLLLHILTFRPDK